MADADVDGLAHHHTPVDAVVSLHEAFNRSNGYCVLSPPPLYRIKWSL